MVDIKDLAFLHLSPQLKIETETPHSETLRTEIQHTMNNTFNTMSNRNINMASLEPPRINIEAPPAYSSSPSISRTPSRDSLSSNTFSLPDYKDAAAPFSLADFTPTVALQIQTPGKRWLSCPGPTRPDPIPIYAVDPSSDASSCSADLTPKYISLRAARRSGNAVLIHGAAFPELASSDPLEPHALTSTMYRFGPGRPPLLRLHGPSGPTPAASFAAMSAASRRKHEPTPETEPWTLSPDGRCTPDSEGAFTTPLAPVSSLSRSMRFTTPHGTLQWRHATRAERAPFAADSLLILERVSDAEAAVPIGYFVRCRETRTPGTSACTAGNGGRLLLDLRPRGVGDEKHAADGEVLERVAVATCLAVLKAEVDRRRLHQGLILAGGASGGC